ncbi:hypothetical protein [Rubinisphaera margarita]|uniref:hypothetical protein n=1 Tax=Rubinisphaera margarita TaxID=2909586 RepID=UPI001EE8B99C|nr:hypothetical protein [Rubinisphaera margarita]MCG6158486.1 hypothetical protein [Rubinisphaera margarita]
MQSEKRRFWYGVHLLRQVAYVFLAFALTFGTSAAVATAASRLAEVESLSEDIREFISESRVHRFGRSRHHATLHTPYSGPHGGRAAATRGQAAAPRSGHRLANNLLAPIRC